jgi:hypothetical protein
MRILSYILWTREIISLMDKKKEITFWGQGIINEASINDKKYLQLYELWCLFAYREFYKKLLVILDEVSLRTYGGKNTSIPNRFCKLFELHDDKKTCVFDEAIQQHSF